MKIQQISYLNVLTRIQTQTIDDSTRLRSVNAIILDVCEYLQVISDFISCSRSSTKIRLVGLSYGDKSDPIVIY